jgi:propionyl-CoA synthetase
MGRYAETYRRSIEDPEGFWSDAATEIDWIKTWDQVLDKSRAPFYRWFTGGQLNTCYNALDRHVAKGRGNQVALIYDSPVTNTTESWTYSRLTDVVARCAGVLRTLGVEKGDRVVIYMPMVPQAAVAMLACARLGAIHSVVFGGFAPTELATRINDATPKLIISASCGIEGTKVLPYKPMLDAAIELSVHKPKATVILQRPQSKAELIPNRDYDWDEALSSAKPADCVPVAATDPLYILYTSGTTGQPKGIVRDNGGHAVALKFTMKNFYNIDPGQSWWAASDVGWVVGHSYIVYAPLLHGATTLLFEGKPVGTPDAGTFWRIISQYKVSALFTAPTAFRAIKREDPNAELLKKYDLSCFNTLFLAGERSDPDTIRWAETHLRVPVIDHWWQTETGWVMCGNPIGTELFSVKYGSACKAFHGWDIRALSADGHEVKKGDVGSLVAKLPLPPGTLMTLWNADERCSKAYYDEFHGYYLTGDAGFIDEDDYVSVMTRVDDVINVAGHRLSTGAMEEVLSAHLDVAECAVVGVADEMKGQIPLGFIVLKAGVKRSHSDVIKEVIDMVRKQIGAVAAFKTAVVVERLPKTRSGKVLRGTMKKIADSEVYKVPATIDDPAILDEIEDALKTVGYATKKTLNI